MAQYDDEVIKDTNEKALIEFNSASEFGNFIDYILTIPVNDAGTEIDFLKAYKSWQAGLKIEDIGNDLRK